MSDDLEFRDGSDPEANGRALEPGDTRYTVWFPLDDGRRLFVHMGTFGVANLRKVIMDRFMDEQFEIQGESSETYPWLDGPIADLQVIRDTLSPSSKGYIERLDRVLAVLKGRRESPGEQI